MSETNFEGPLSIGSKTGAPTTDTTSFVPAVKQAIVSQGDPEVDVTVPSGTVRKLGFVPTSAFTGGDSVTAMNVTFSNGTVVLGVLQVSAATRYVETTTVSGAVLDSDTSITVAISAAATTTFTGGGGRALIEVVKVS